MCLSALKFYRKCIKCKSKMAFFLLRLRSIFKRVKTQKDQHPHVVFDSNQIQHGSVTQHEYSPDGKYCAFTISDKSLSSVEVLVINVESGETCGKCLKLFSFEKIAWSGDSQGFFVYVNIPVGLVTSKNIDGLVSCNSIDGLATI